MKNRMKIFVGLNTILTSIYAQDNGIADPFVTLLNCLCYQLREILLPFSGGLFAFSIFLFILAHYLGDDYGKKVRPYAWAILIGAIIGGVVYMIAPTIMSMASPADMTLICTSYHC